MHTYGVIPDARSARFEIWRDYEDKRLTDVSYYLKLNHSRLIMSKLKYRPELISDVQVCFCQIKLLFLLLVRVRILL